MTFTMVSFAVAINATTKDTKTATSDMTQKNSQAIREIRAGFATCIKSKQHATEKLMVEAGKFLWRSYKSLKQKHTEFEGITYNSHHVTVVVNSLFSAWEQKLIPHHFWFDYDVNNTDKDWTWLCTAEILRKFYTSKWRSPKGKKPIYKTLFDATAQLHEESKWAAQVYKLYDPSIQLFDFDPFLRDLWPVECKRSSFETPLKMQNL